MMDKLIRSMFYGSARTKAFLWGILIFGLLAFGMLVAAIALGIPVLGLGAVGLGFVTFVVSQSVSVETLEKQKKNKKEKGVIEAGKNERHPKARERAKSRYLASLNAKDVKKLLKEHKVKQSHVKVMIDLYEDRMLQQVPAFAWRTDTHLHFLVLEGRANEFEIPLEEIRGIFFEKNVETDPDQDYGPMKYETYIAKMFAPFLPEYHEYSKEGEIGYRKNLFWIKPGIYFTNSSVANLMSILPNIPFLVDDNICRSDRVDEYFKELYRYSILCKNMVMSREDYKKQINKTLDALLDAPVSAKKFVAILQNMARYHLIGREDVTRYIQKYRDKKGNAPSGDKNSSTRRSAQR